MLFRRIILSALLAGLLASLVLSATQLAVVNPIIFAAEQYEVVGHDHGSHDHSEEAWAPEDGGERTFYTLLSNFLAATGFAAVLLSLMSQMQMLGVSQLTISKGALWGLAGFAAFFVAPSLGVPPEIPGIEAAPVEYRQWWWLLAVTGVGIGLLIIHFAPLKFKVGGAILVALPYLVTIPHVQGPAFRHPDPESVKALTQLHEQFILMSTGSNLLFWLVLGVISAWVLNRWILESQASDSADVSTDS